jgi:hypothetical protein
MSAMKRADVFGLSLLLFVGSPLIFLFIAATSIVISVKAYLVLFLGPIAGVVGFIRALSMPITDSIASCSYCTLLIKPDQRTACAACKVVIHKECRDGHERVYHDDGESDAARARSTYRD